MSWTSGTTTAADATYATTAMGLLHTAITAHSAWTYIEERVVLANTYRIYQCKGTSNSWGQDFYLIVRRATAGTGTLAFFIAEDYSAATGLATRSGGAASSSHTPDATYNALVAGAVALSALELSTNGQTVSPAAAATQYWIGVTSDYVVVKWGAGTGTTNCPVFSGMFTSYFADHPNEFPIAVTTVGSNGSNYGSMTRAPGSTSTSSNYGAAILGWSGADTTEPRIGIIGGTIPAVCNGKARGGRASLYQTGNNQRRGYVNSLLLFGVTAAAAVGDTITIGSDTWVLLHSETSVATFFNQAAA